MGSHGVPLDMFWRDTHFSSLAPWPRERMLDCTNYGTDDARRLRRRLAKEMKCASILEAVGRTPLVRLNRINQGLRPQIYVKADYINPGGSVKDRIGITMIDEA
jgi:threonine synthase